ncbi:MAG: ABC-type iron transport system FetAB ATPase subunit [Paracoccaceae bacterium]|jgi:ABC-type iron transport system FetAB ATPase subunit
MLQVKGLSRLTLGPVDLEVADGDCLAITGPSGTGKSVLLRAIADLDPNEGTVSCASCARDAVTGPDWRGRVALLPAESGWWGDAVAGHFRDPEGQRDLLDQVGMPSEAMGWDVARLSTGERHRLALMRALERVPEVLLLDEPTTMLDSGTTLLVEAMLRARMAQGLSILMVTHEAEQPVRMGARALWLEGGQLRDVGQRGVGL